MEKYTVYRVPGDIRDELCIAVLFLALGDVDIRAPCEPVLRATDATPSGFGGARQSAQGESCELSSDSADTEEST